MKFEFYNFYLIFYLKLEIKSQNRCLDIILNRQILNLMDLQLRCLLILILLGLAASQSTAVEKEKTTIVEGNHFYSNHQLTASYDVASVNTNRSLILILRKKEQTQVFDNPLTINLYSGDKSVQCKFASFLGMCFLGQIPQSNMTMKLKCDHLPCELSWTLFQPSIKKIENSQVIEQMYDISQSNNHMIAMISCNNPEVKNFDKLVSTYSENQYVRGYTNNIIYLLFKKHQTGHLYFQLDPAAKACAHMAIHNVSEQIKPDETNKDFVFSNESSIYKIGVKPQGQVRLDCAYHEMTKQAIKSDIILSLTGQKAGTRQIINNITVKPPIATTDFQFSWAIPVISGQFTNLQIEAKSSNAMLIFNSLLSLSQRYELEGGEHSYFNATKGTILKYKIVPQPGAEQSQELSIVPLKNNVLNISKKTCPRKDGCEFEVEILADLPEGQAGIYIGGTAGASLKGQATFFDFKGSVTKKIRDQELIYLRTPIKKDQVIQVVVNNPNVIIRASSEQKCPVPNAQCYQHIANSHHHFIYQPKKDGNLLMAVEGLDSCQFTISVIQEGTESIELKNGEPFLYVLDDKQSKLEFKFSVPEKTGVSFNLIAPLNDLILVVNNGKQKPNGDEHAASTDGYISFTKQELESNEFRVLVEKTPQSKDKFVHFTLIATTLGTNLRLDPGVAHAQSLKPLQYKQFVFEFDKKGDYILNLYTPSIDKEQMKINLLVNNEDKWNDGKFKKFSIDQNSDVLNLKDVSESLCIQSGDIQCQIFLRVSNRMSIQIDITLTLLVKDSVIELKDGQWQTYAINTIAQTSHFYFLPKTKNSSIDIMHKSSLVDLGISYTIWKSDKQNIDPSQWPFPPYKENIQDKFSFFKSINHVMIDSENIKGCWPQCVILISLFKKKGFSNDLFSKMDPNHQGNFSLMVANKILEIPEKTKLQVMIKQNQQKYLMVDLKHTTKKQAITFFVNQMLGSFVLYGNVYSQKHPRCPTQDQHDFNFGQIETQIKVSSIETKRQENDMTEDQDYYLCILAYGYLESKFTIQYTSDEDIIKLLRLDQFERFSITPRQTKYFQLEATQQYEIKITREKGYFYVKLAVCKDEDGKGYQQCLQQLQSDSKDRGKQIITKTEQFSDTPCTKCILFLKISTDDPAEGIIHVQSKYSMVDLKQKDTISDFLNQGQTNRYSITSVQKQQTIISISVTEGEPVVTVSNYGDLNITKQKDKKTGNILIVIPPEKVRENSLGTALGNINYDAFAYSSTFRYLIVEVKSKDPKLAAAYTITYSSGERQSYLEDGLVVSYTLEAKKKAKFLYKNPSLYAHGYLSISMDKSSTLYNLDFKLYTMTDSYDQDTKVDVTPSKPPMRKHTPHPTIVYDLPVSNLVIIQLQSSTEQKVTLMILHQQLVILPFDVEFPYQMHRAETINLITDVNNPGFLLINIRKCDQSSPDFGYTFDYDSFQRGQFQYTTNLADDPKFQFFIKASKIGTLYMQMNSTDDNGLFSIMIHYNNEKIKGAKAKPGKNGILDYQIVDSSHAKISFSGVVCSGSKCEKQTKYYWMAGNNIQDVYTQTVCPYSYFQILNIISSQPIEIVQISARPDSNGLITFDYPYKDHITYVSVKAVTGSDEIYYQPIQVVTLWGTVTKTSKTNKFVIGVTSLFVCICLCICFRRCQKKSPVVPGYDVLPDAGETLDY